MRVCVLHPSYEGSQSPCNGLDPHAVPQTWKQPDDHFDHLFLRKATAVKDLISFASTARYDVYINLCDGAWDEDRPGLEVVQTLERLNVPFTGADSNFYEPSKETMKKVAIYHDVDTARYALCSSKEDARKAAEELSFPLIVKHPSGYSSVGMTAASKCLNENELVTQVTTMVAAFGCALVEEFISGQEFTVLVSDNPRDLTNPIVYAPVECKFPANEEFKHFDLKWKDFDGLTWCPVDDVALAKQLRDMAKSMFTALRGVGYGRCVQRRPCNVSHDHCILC